jgi:hypothetical protein
MRRIFALLLLLSLLLSIQPARAQAEPSLASVLVKIWPEYDKPSVLVIYQIAFSPQTTLPATVTFRIPKAAVKPLVVAVGATPAEVTDQNVKFTLDEKGDWVNVNIEVTGPALQLEFYDPSISIEGTQRSFTYTWPGDYAVAAFSVEVQQPYDASGMLLVPALADALAVPDGLTYHTGNFGALAKGEALKLDVKYQKASDALSVSFMTVEPSAPVNDSTAGRVSLETYLPWLVGAFSILMITGGLYYYLRGTARSVPSVRRRHPSRDETAEGQVYCPQCGTRARGGDRFCRTCGTRLRTETEN